MWLFNRKQRKKRFKAQEAEIKAIHQETLSVVNETYEETHKANKLWEEKSVAEVIYKAAGLERRGK